MIKNIMFLIFACIFTVACSNMRFESKELIKIKKGLSSEQVMELIDNEESVKVVKINNNLINEIKMPINPNKYTIIIAWKSQSYLSNTFICAFENDKLIYWGTQLEYARHNSLLLNAIGEEVVKQLTRGNSNQLMESFKGF